MCTLHDCTLVLMYTVTSKTLSLFRIYLIRVFLVKIKWSVSSFLRFTVSLNTTTLEKELACNAYSSKEPNNAKRRAWEPDDGVQ